MNIVFKTENERGNGTTYKLLETVKTDSTAIFVAPNKMLKRYAIERLVKEHGVSQKEAESKVISYDNDLTDFRGILSKQLWLCIDEGLSPINVLKLIQMLKDTNLKIDTVIVSDY